MLFVFKSYLLPKNSMSMMIDYLDIISIKVIDNQ